MTRGARARQRAGLRKVAQPPELTAPRVPPLSSRIPTRAIHPLPPPGSWDAPVSLTRVWCLYEIMHAHLALDQPAEHQARDKRTKAAWHGSPMPSQSSLASPHTRGFPQLERARAIGGQRPSPSAAAVLDTDQQPPRERSFHLTMPTWERARLLQTINDQSGGQAAVLRALSAFDARHAQASVDADRRLILQLIQAHFAPGRRGASLGRAPHPPIQTQGHRVASLARAPRPSDIPHAVGERDEADEAFEAFNATVRTAITTAAATISWSSVTPLTRRRAGPSRLSRSARSTSA